MDHVTVVSVYCNGPCYLCVCVLSCGILCYCCVCVLSLSTETDPRDDTSRIPGIVFDLKAFISSIVSSSGSVSW